MENLQKKHITKNMPRLTSCTKNLSLLRLELGSNGFVSNSIWQGLEKKNTEEMILINDIYQECTKTPDYEGLIECLKNSENETAAKILEELSAPAPKTVTSPNKPVAPASAATSNSNAAAGSTDDFEVKQVHIAAIANIVEANLDADEWTEVKKSWLDQKLLNKAGKNSTVKLDIMSSIKVWSSYTKREERIFSKLVKAFEDYPAIVEQLEEKAAELGAM